MENPILVILAAGIGSRYGGLKQMDALGKNGEVLMDYSVYDALRSGFEKIIFIIRRGIEEEFRSQVISRIGSKIKWEFAYQEQDSLIPHTIFTESQKCGRTKPWGTTHALLCAADKIDRPFSLINADDFYGLEAYAALGRHLCSPSRNDPAIVPYRLEKTLSAQGTVARGLCEIKDDYLVSIEELTAIEKKDGGIINTSPNGSVRHLAPDSPVSMNFWGFPPAMLPEFSNYFNAFLEDYAKDIPNKIKSECFIPHAVDYCIKNKINKIKAIQANSDWFGITYKEEREEVIKKLSGLFQAKIYPESLW